MCKVAPERYRCQFFYSGTGHYGTGHDEHNSPGDCVLTLLQIQSDHERPLANISSNAALASINDDDYGPAVIWFCSMPGTGLPRVERQAVCPGWDRTSVTE